MDFVLTEEQQMFRTMVRDFAAREIEPMAAELDEKEHYPIENYKKLAEVGLTGVTIPEKYGGSGGGTIELVIATEEVARACAGTATLLYVAGLSLGTHSIYKFGNEEQKQRFVVPLARGEKIACFGLTEAGAGSDAAALETTATKQADGYVINGTKLFISNGLEAEIIVVFATIDKALKHRGITAFIVERSTPGYSVGKKERKLGIRASSTTELIFDNCRIPKENLLGEEGRGLRLALEIIDGSRITVAAQAVGIARAALEASLSYAKERRQFGQPLAEFQAIQWMLADMATQTDAARLLTFRAACLEDNHLPFVKEAAMAKVFAAETAMWVSNKAIQVHGGYGYTKDYPVERYYRDAKITEIYEGTSEMQRMTIIRNLLRE